MICDLLLELADEFDEDAESFDRVSEKYKDRGMDLQYQIFWHEAATYRNCSDRLRQKAANKAAQR